jgi:hypothetical protein
MSHLVGKNDGLFDPSKRFAFTNISEEVFTSAWGGAPIVVQPGQTVELPHHLANKLTDELVDKIMIGNVKMDEVEYYKKNPNTAPNMFRAPNSLGVPAARKVWEDQIVRELAVDEESPQVQVMRAELKAQLEAELSAQPAREPVQVPTNIAEFSELNNVGQSKPAAAPKPIKLKTVGRPKKDEAPGTTTA